MRIVAISDLHIGKQNPKINGRRIAYLAKDVRADVLYAGGDLGEPASENPKKNLKKALQMLSGSLAPVKLLTLGNNDIETIDSVLTRHYEEIQDIASAYGFHLLDRCPYVLGNTAFIGNIGWYDGTLWKPYPGRSQHPNTPDAIRRHDEHAFAQKFAGHLPRGLTSTEFYQHCRQRLQDHLDQVHMNPSIEQVVLGIHFVPSKTFLKYDTDRYTFFNWFMGSSGHLEHYLREKVILGFTSHTHRNSELHIAGRTIYNISGKEQPGLFEI